MQNRLIYVDIAKAVAIFLVVWMHCIQYLFHTTFENNLYAVVYTFHMPLFLIISGFLLSTALKSPVITAIKKRTIRLLLPNLLWGGVLAFVVGKIDLSAILTSFWFLNTLLICSVSYIIALRFMSVPIAVVILSIGVLLLGGCEYIKFSMPFVGIGIYIRCSNIIDKFQSPMLLVLGAVLLIFAYIFIWNKSYYIYLTPSPRIFNPESYRWKAYFVRLLFGTAVSVEILSILKYLEKRYLRTYNSLISSLSSNSLGLYVIHLFILVLVTDSVIMVFDSLNSYPFLPTLLSLLIAIGMTIAINHVIHFLKRFRLTNNFV